MTQVTVRPAVFSSQRSRVLKAYAGADQEVIANTIPYHSTGVLRFDVVAPSVATPPGNAFAVCRAQQQVSFFGYGVGEQVRLGGINPFSTATDVETNLAKGRSTNGAQDYIIEAIGLQNKALRAQFTGDNRTAIVALAAADPTVIRAIDGDCAWMDPAALVLPPQAQSPFNLEQALYQAVAPLMAIDIVFDRRIQNKIGTADLMPQAGAASYLRANGSPESSNRYRIPEGYLWRKDGQADCELEVNLTLLRDLVVPLNGVATWASPAVNVMPTTIWLEITCRLYGLAVNMPSAN